MEEGMATTAAPLGFRPIGYLGGRPYNGAVREFRIRSTYATRIGEGDVVRVGGSGDSSDEGYLMKETGTTSLATPIGVFKGCRYTDPNTGQIVFKNQYPGGITASDIVAYVVDDPDAVFEAQANGAVVQAELGENCALVQGSGTNTLTGMSSHGVNATTATTNTLPFRVVGFADRPGSTVGDAFTDVHVAWNAGIHAYRAATAR